VADIDSSIDGSSLDSVLYLLDDSDIEITHNDDYDGLDSRLEFVLPYSGTYFLRIKDYYHDGGRDYYYQISLSITEYFNFLPVVFKN
jgi:hypothetical protein